MSTPGFLHEADGAFFDENGNEITESVYRDLQKYRTGNNAKLRRDRIAEAMMAAQISACDPHKPISFTNVAVNAVIFADALIAELDK